jgi:hypothetical protein
VIAVKRSLITLPAVITISKLVMPEAKRSLATQNQEDDIIPEIARLDALFIIF